MPGFAPRGRAEGLHLDSRRGARPRAPAPRPYLQARLRGADSELRELRPALRLRRSLPASPSDSRGPWLRRGARTNQRYRPRPRSRRSQ